MALIKLWNIVRISELIKIQLQLDRQFFGISTSVVATLIKNFWPQLQGYTGSVVMEKSAESSMIIL